jgi:hypothetical protein
MTANQPDTTLFVAPMELGDPSFQDWHSLRDAKRDRVVRIVEYSHYPRTCGEERRKIGFTRDESATGMCILVDDREKKGELLRVLVSSIDGQAGPDALARVVWCEEREDGRYWVGIALMEQSRRRMRKVRRPVEVPEAKEANLTAI